MDPHCPWERGPCKRPPSPVFEDEGVAGSPAHFPRVHGHPARQLRQENQGGLEALGLPVGQLTFADRLGLRTSGAVSLGACMGPACIVLQGSVAECG